MVGFVIGVIIGFIFGFTLCAFIYLAAEDNKDKKKHK